MGVVVPDTHPPSTHPPSPKLQANLATVYTTLATRGELAGVAIGSVAESVCLDPPRGEEADALAAVAGAALRASGWHRITDNVFINVDWATLEGPTSVAVAALGADSEVAPPASARIAIRVSPSRVAPFTPDAALEAAGKLRSSASAPADARALSDALFGCVAVPLPSLEEATIVGVIPAWQGDAALLTEWRDAVGRPDLPAPYLWVQCVPGDDNCDAAAAAAVSGEGLFVPPTCLLLPPVLPSVPAEGGRGLLHPQALAPLAAVVDALEAPPFAVAFWGAAPRVVGVADRVLAPSAASAWASAGQGGGSAPADAWRVTPLPPSVATRARAPIVPGPELAAALEEAAAARRTAELPPPLVMRAAAAAGVATVAGAPTAAPVLSKRKVVTLAGVHAPKPEAVAKVAAKPAAKKIAASTTTTTKRAPKAAPDAAAVADKRARVVAAYAAGTQAKLTADDLKTVLKAAGHKVGGKKADLLERVAGVLAMEK